MFLKLIAESIKKRKKAFLAASLSIALGSMVAGYLLTLSFYSETQLAKELKRYGANFIITGKGAKVPLFSDATLLEIKQTFWKNQFMAMSPFLMTPVRIEGDTKSPPVPLIGTHFKKGLQVASNEQFESGIESLHPLWRVRGKYPRDEKGSEGSEVIAGEKLARIYHLQPGSPLILEHQGKTHSFKVTGILTTGMQEEEQLFAPLPFVQKIAGHPHAIEQIQASVLFHAPDSLSQKDPKQMSSSEYDKWYCTPYIHSITTQLGKTFPRLAAHPIEEMVQVEGDFLRKISLLLWIISLAALLTGGLGVMSTLMSIVLDRRMEIGLMKALGATPSGFANLFLSEVSLIGLGGGLLGYAAGFLLARGTSHFLFHSPIPFDPLVFLVSLGIAWSVSLVSALWPIIRALQFEPILVLKEH